MSAPDPRIRAERDASPREALPTQHASGTARLGLPLGSGSAAGTFSESQRFSPEAVSQLSPQRNFVGVALYLL